MLSYSSAKLELLALKWVVMEKLGDYLLGSKFTIYTDNNPLAYIKESKLGMAQIRWLSKLALFDFDIKYRWGKSNQAADTLSCHPKTENENSSDCESDGCETVSYTVVCHDLSEVIKGEKLPLEIKRAVQVEIIQQVPDSEKVSAHSKMMDVLSRVTPSMMKEAQEVDVDISKTICYINQQFDRLVFCQEVLHKVHEQDGAKFHQLNLPIKFRAQAMELFHNKQGHQPVECMLLLVCERFYWSTFFQDVMNWVKIVSSVKLPRVCMLIQIHHMDQLLLTIPWIYYT